MLYLFLALLVIALAAIALTPRFSPGLYRRLTFNPQAGANAPAPAAPHEEIFFSTADGVKLHGMYFHHPDARATVVLNHGNAGVLPGWGHLAADIAAGAGVSVLVYDYRGFGKSEAKTSLTGVSRDGLAAYDYLVRERGVKPNSIIALGWSIGSIAACAVVTRRQTRGLVLFGAFASLRTLTSELMPRLGWLIHSPFFFKEKGDNAASIKSLNGSIPVVITQASDDQLIGMHHARALHDSTGGAGQLIVLEGCTHSNITPDKDKLFAAIAKMAEDSNRK